MGTGGHPSPTCLKVEPLEILVQTFASSKCPVLSSHKFGLGPGPELPMSVPRVLSRSAHRGGSGGWAHARNDMGTASSSWVAAPRVPEEVQAAGSRAQDGPWVSRRKDTTTPSRWVVTIGIAGSQAGTTGAKAFRHCLSVPSWLSPTGALPVHGRCGASLSSGSHPSPRPLSSPSGGALAQGPTGASKAQLSSQHLVVQAWIRANLGVRTKKLKQ